MKTGKSNPKSGMKTLNEKLQRATIQQIISPVSKKTQRTIFLGGENTQLLKRNSIRSIQLKDRQKQKDKQRYKEQGKQKNKEDSKVDKKEQLSKPKSKRDSGESTRLKKIPQTKQPEEQKLKIGSQIPLFYAINDLQEIEPSFAVNNISDNNPSCISQISKGDYLINEQEWQVDTKLIGAGSRAQVYKAFNKFTAKIAAVKKIMTEDQIYNREVKIISELKHPNIVQYYGYTALPGQLSIYMEFIPTTLKHIYSNFGGFIPYQNVRKYTRQLVDALKCIHNLKIIHKDIKCQNILLNQKGIIKLTDFGESKQFNHSTSMSANKAGQCSISLRGSIRWIAPQSLKNNLYTRKSDIWSLGCTVLQMATGKIPWSQFETDNFITDIVNINASTQPPRIPNDLPQDLIDFLNKCLVLDVQKRMTAQQLQKTPFLMKK